MILFLCRLRAANSARLFCHAAGLRRRNGEARGLRTYAVFSPVFLQAQAGSQLNSIVVGLLIAAVGGDLVDDLVHGSH